MKEAKDNSPHPPISFFRHLSFLLYRMGFLEKHSWAVLCCSFSLSLSLSQPFFFIFTFWPFLSTRTVALLAGHAYIQVQPASQSVGQPTNSTLPSEPAYNNQPGLTFTMPVLIRRVIPLVDQWSRGRLNV